MWAYGTPCPAMVSPNVGPRKEGKLLYPDHHLIRCTKSGFRPTHCPHGGSVCLSACWDTTTHGADTPKEQTPPGSRHPEKQTLLGTDTPPEQTPLGADPPEQTPPRSRHTPPEQTPPWSRPPRSRHPPEQTPPRADTPQRDGHCCGWYTSYWNAFLFNLCFSYFGFGSC